MFALLSKEVYCNEKKVIESFIKVQFSSDISKLK